MSVTDADLLQEIQFAVIEPPDGGVTWPSGLWSSAEVLAYLNLRQDQLLKETLLLVGQETEITVAEGVTRLDLPFDWLRTIRVLWLGDDGTVRPLHRTDSFAADAGLSGWNTVEGLPSFYMDEEAGTLTIQIAPPPAGSGKLDLFYIPLGDPLTLAPDILNVPDECAWILKYGVLADMLGKDGEGRDVARAEYAQQRYDMGVEAVKMLMQGWVS